MTISEVLQMLADGVLRPDDVLIGNRMGNIAVERDRRVVAWLDCSTQVVEDIFNPFEYDNHEVRDG